MELEVPSPGVVVELELDELLGVDVLLEPGVLVELLVELLDVGGGSSATMTEIVYERAEPETGSEIWTVTKFVPGSKSVSP